MFLPTYQIACSLVPSSIKLPLSQVDDRYLNSTLGPIIILLEHFRLLSKNNRQFQHFPRTYYKNVITYLLMLLLVLLMWFFLFYMYFLSLSWTPLTSVKENIVRKPGLILLI